MLFGRGPLPASGGLIVLIVVAVMALIALLSAVRIVREYERVVVFRLGRLRGPRGPGLVLVIPLIERTRWVNLQVDTADIPSQDLITNDNVTVRVDAAVFFRVVDPIKAVVEIRDYQHGVLRIAQSTLRATLGQHDLDDLLANQAAINELLKQIIDKGTEPWGINVVKVETKDVDLPDEMKRAMARQAEAGRERRAKVIAAEDEYFFAEQNAAVVANAEEYYRTMFSERAGSWNLRDRHMADTLDQLLAHLDRHGGTSRLVVWAHNSHVGDARATEMASRGELNIGQLMRERHGHDAVNVGFSTYTGTVTAASEWGGPAERKRVRAALPDSYEALFHRTHLDARSSSAPARRGQRTGASRAPASPRDRRHLPPRDRAPEPLVRGQPRAAVRRARPSRPHPGG